MNSDIPFALRGAKRTGWIARGGFSADGVLSALFLAAVFALVIPAAAQVTGSWQSQDVGAVSAAGNASEAGGVVTVRGAGDDIWGGNDEFHFRYLMLTGDGEIKARVTSIDNTDPWAKAGIMIRESLAPGARNAFVFLSGQQTMGAQYRVDTGGGTAVPQWTYHSGSPMWLWIVRRGSTVSMSASRDGVSWQPAGVTLDLPATAYIGLAVTSHRDGTLCRATFDTVSTRAAASESTTPPAAPTQLTATAVSSTRIQLSWVDNSNDETGFEIERSLDGGSFAHWLTVDANVTSRFDDGLTPGTPYYYRVRARRNTGFSVLQSGWSNTVSATTTSSPPSTAWQSRDIGSVSAAGRTVVNVSSVTVTGSGEDIWGRLDEGQFYYRTLSGDGEIVARLTAFDNTHSAAKAGIMMREGLGSQARNVFLHLSPDFVGTFQYRGVAEGETAIVASYWMWPPTWLKLVRRGTQFTALLSLDGVQWQGGRTVDLALANDLQVGIAVTSHRDGTLANATFDLVTASATNEGSPPAAPTGFSAYWTGNRRNVHPQWTDNSNDETAWEIFGSEDNLNFGLLTTVNAHLSRDGLVFDPPGTASPYYLKVRAVRGTAASAFSNVATVTFTAPVAKPADFTATAVSSWEIRLRWTDNSTAETTFTVERSTNGTSFVEQALVPANSTTYIDQSLIPATRYYYRMRAHGTGGPGPYSDIVSATTPAAPPPTNSGPWLSGDVGGVRATGRTEQSGSNFTVWGSGADIWGASDAFHFFSQSLSGDGEIVARVNSMANTDAWAKAGIMMRSSRDAGAANVFLFATPASTVGFQHRLTAGGDTRFSGYYWSGPAWLKLVRAGNTFRGYVSSDGTNWTLLNSAIVELGQTVLVGLAVTSHRDGTLCNAAFEQVAVRGDNVSNTGIVPTAPANLSAMIASPRTTTPSIALTWTDRSTNETRFEIERASSDTAPFLLVGSAPANATSFTDTGLSRSTFFYYRVRAIGSGDAPSAYSNAIQTGTGLSSNEWDATTIGRVGQSMTFNGSDTLPTVRIDGGGEDIWGTADGFNFAYKTLQGDATIVTQVTRLDPTHPWAKAGLMIRESIQPGSRHVMAFLSAENGAGAHTRASTNGSTSITAGPWWASVPYWLKLVRSGSTVSTYASADGAAWSLMSTETFALGTEILIGVAAASHDVGALNHFIFADLKVTQP